MVVMLALCALASKFQLNYLKDLRGGFNEDVLRVEWQVEF